MKFINIKKVKIIAINLLSTIASVYWRIFKPRTVGAAVLIKNGSKILLIQNTYRKKWYIPGGGNSRKEKLIDTAIRETYEEIGVTLDKDDLRLLGIYQNNTEGKENISVVFLAEKNISLKALKLSETEISTAGYFDLNDLPKDLSEGVKVFIKDLRSGSFPAVGFWGDYRR